MCLPKEGLDIVRETILNSNSFFVSPSRGTLEARSAVAKHFSGQNYQLLSDDIILTHGAN